jgi:hypothetical protein
VIKIAITLLVLFTSNISIYSQQIVEVKNIKGLSFIVGDISPNMARIQAINDAKINALKAAGIEENINSYKSLFTSQENNNYSQFFSSNIQSEIQGAVKDYKLIEERVYAKSENELVSEVTINAKVIKYNTKPDLSFDANIEGIKAVYNNGDSLTFQLKTTQKSYLSVFNITDKDASLLYPNYYEKQTELKSGQLYRFPLGKIEYILDSDSKQVATNRFIFVFTKTLVPFIKMNQEQIANSENILSWINSIMPDQKRVIYRPITIQK